MSSFFKKIFIVIFLICYGSLHSQTQDSIYLFSYFKENGEDGLHLASSLNGKNWKAVNNDNKHVIVYGLDGDHEQNLFGDIVKLIPHADNVHKLKSLCKTYAQST